MTTLGALKGYAFIALFCLAWNWRHVRAYLQITWRLWHINRLDRREMRQHQAATSATGESYWGRT